MKIIALVVLAGCAHASSPDLGDLDNTDAAISIDAREPSIDAPSRPPVDSGSVSPDAHEPTQVTLTQVSSNALAASSLACQDVNATAKQAYYRVFDLATLGITTPLTLSGVAFGVQSASGNQIITVNVGTYAGTPGDTLDVGASSSNDWAAGDVTAIATATATVTSASSNTIVNVPIAATIPGSSNLIIEVRSPQDTGSTNFYLGASSGTETTPGFFWSPTCDATPPGTPTELGEGVVPFVITATGSY